MYGLFSTQNVSTHYAVHYVSLLTMPLGVHSINGISLDAAGLVAIADLSIIKDRTALAGSASPLDVLFLAPGIHTQQAASEVNGGETPQAAQLNKGYVFRIENQATVSYLQRVGETGKLVTVKVKEDSEQEKRHKFLVPLLVGGPLASVLYVSGMLLTLASLIVLGTIHDFWAMGALIMLIVARGVNALVTILRTRVQEQWKGGQESEGEDGDVLVILSQDRWVRMRGGLQDIKTVTAGQWMRDQTPSEGFVSAFATLLVFVSSALGVNASTAGSLIIAVLLFLSAPIRALCNALTTDLHMFGRRLYVDKTIGPQKLDRKREMVEYLTEQSERDDWAVGMELIPDPDRPKLLKSGQQVLAEAQQHKVSLCEQNLPPDPTSPPPLPHRPHRFVPTACARKIERWTWA